MATTTTRQRQYRPTGPLQSRASGSPLSNLALIVALVMALGGLGLAVQMLLNRAPVTAIGQEAQVGGLTLKVESAQWMIMDHGSHQDDDGQSDNPEAANISELKAQGQVFPMPDNMMPDMPQEGQQRLKVEVMLHNLAGSPREVRPEEFSLHSAGGETVSGQAADAFSSADGESWNPRSGNGFRASTLEPGQALTAVIFFDVDETATGLYLVWNRGGSRVRIPIDDPTGHDH